MIRKLAEKYDITISDSNFINLSYVNGWSKKINDFYKEIKKFKNTSTVNSEIINNNVAKFSALYKDESNETFQIVWFIDSSD